MTQPPILETLERFSSKNKVPVLIIRSTSPKNEADAAMDKENIFRLAVSALCVFLICSNVGA